MIMQKVLWWATFVFSTYALSKVFEASRGLTLGTAPGSESWLSLILWGTLLVAGFLLLGYDAYVKAQQEGKVVHRIWIYEKFQQYQQEKHR